MAVKAAGTATERVLGMRPLEHTRKSDFSAWYRTVIKESGLAQSSVVPGCMVFMPNGCALWDRMKTELDGRFKEGKHCTNAMFPLFIPAGLFAKEKKRYPSLPLDVQ